MIFADENWADFLVGICCHHSTILSPTTKCPDVVVLIAPTSIHQLLPSARRRTPSKCPCISPTGKFESLNCFKNVFLLWNISSITAFQNENPSLTIAEDNLNNTEGFPDTQSRIRGISVNRPSINDYHGGRYLMSGGFNNYVNNPFLRAFTIMSTSTVTAFKTAISTATSTSFSASTSISIITSIISTISVSTSTIMNTAVLSLTLVVKCVPSFQVSPSPFACRRKKEIDYSEDSHQQFLISPSQTLK